jgi:hypothetical protein
MIAESHRPTAGISITILFIVMHLGFVSCQSQEQGLTTGFPKTSPRPQSLDTIHLQIAPEGGTPYRRKDWMEQWADTDNDCRSTRHEILESQSLEPVAWSPDGCKVYRGAWLCPYTGITFKDSRKVDIDHVVALKEAHESGAWNWPKALQTQFANGMDPEELIPVEKKTNQKKSDLDPKDWLPREDTCGYIARWARIKSRWNLSVDPQEAEVIQDLFGKCGSKQPMPPLILK